MSTIFVALMVANAIMADKYKISTYGRDTFKKCRVLWEMTSSLRLGFTTDKPPYHFTFGEAWHRAMETLYEPGPDYQTDIRTKAAIAAFEEVIRNQRREIARFGNDSPESEKEYREMLELGPKMIEYYAGWAKLNDDFEPVTVEHEFEVPITNDKGQYLVGIDDGVRYVDYLDDNQTPVVYTGRVDGLARDYRGHYWVLEHKSAKKEGPTWWLQMNDQVSSYEWALREKLGVQIKGTIYTIAYKRAPEYPKVLKNGSVSCDRRQNTTAAMFGEAVAKAHPLEPTVALLESDEKYSEYYKFLTNPEVAPKFIERHVLRRNPNQIKDVGRRIAMEARNMLDDPDIYQTITSMNCSSCAFRSPCLTRQDGGDWLYQLNSEFPKRS